MKDKSQKLKIDLSFLDDDNKKDIPKEKQSKTFIKDGKYHPWTCQYCNEEFKTKSEVDEHEEICKLNPQNITSDKEPEYIWTCDYCGKEFSSKSKADNHELTCEKNTKNEKEVWTCDFCNKEFETKREADEHEKTCNLNLETKETKTKVFCTNCGMENPSNANFCKKCGNKIII